MFFKALSPEGFSVVSPATSFLRNHTQIHLHTHAHTQNTYTHKHTKTHTHTHTHTHTQVCFQSQENFEKIQKCIPLCSFVCFELCCKASESLKLLILLCDALFLVKIPSFTTIRT